MMQASMMQYVGKIGPSRARGELVDLDSAEAEKSTNRRSDNNRFWLIAKSAKSD